MWEWMERWMYNREEESREMFRRELTDVCMGRVKKGQKSRWGDE